MYKGKNIAVIGMARTGLAIAEAMTDLGANVILYDSKNASELAGALDTARRLGVEARVGTNKVDLIGVDLLVPSPGVPGHIKAFEDAKNLGIEIISEIELAYRISKAPILAVTGTNGKTTTTVLTGLILAADGKDTFVAGNVAGIGNKHGKGMKIHSDKIAIPLITAAHRASENSVIAAEISTFQLEWVNTFCPKAAALLNVSMDHMDRHASIEEYASLKARIFENQTSDCFSVINMDNPFTASLKSTLKGIVLAFSSKDEVENGAFIRGNDLVFRIDSKETIMCTKSDIRIRGEHNLENVLAAGCLTMAYGVNPESIAKAVRDFGGVANRLESVAIIDGVEYINNSMCTNVDAAVRSVDAFEEPQIVIAGGKDKGADYTELGKAFKRRAKHVVLIGADAQLLHDAANKAGFFDMSRADSMQEAVHLAKSIAQPGDVVVLTPGCASFDMFNSFEHRGEVFKSAVDALIRH